jgi:branched-chain amino acid aminotransferase
MASIPFDQREGYIWIDGEIKPWAEAKVHYLTHALHYGTLVFEGERAYKNNIFKSRDHSERLINSARLIHMDMHHTVDQIEQIKQEVMKANNLTNAYLRVAAWRGSEQMGIDVTGTKTHMAVAAWDWGSYFDPAVRETGLALGISDWRRPNPNSAPIKSKCAALYNLGCMAKYEQKQKGFHDALMFDHEGYIAESTGSNMFLIKDGALHTPTPDRFLNGITRRTVIDIANDMGIEIIERRIKPEELETFQEVFVTGTAAEVTPVGKIDNMDYGIGPVTRKLRAAYEDLTGAS